MVRGIRYQEGMEPGQLKEAGFGLVEYDYGQLKKEKFDLADIYSQKIKPHEDEADLLSGLIISYLPETDDGLKQVLEGVSDLGVSYLVIETVGIEDRTDITTDIAADMTRLLELYAEEIRISGIKVYIENGYCNSAAGIMHSAFSHVSVMKETVDRLNRIAGEACFGICLNTGHANLLGRNICGMIDSLGQRIGLLHASDNNGRTSQMQLPYTFTRGRGELSTDWYGIIGALAMAGFKGQVVYDISGLLAVSPVCLHPEWYRLLSSIAREWENILELEEYLKEASGENADSNLAKGKKAGRLVLFGAGNMFTNYMDVWGNVYPPSFIVDNNHTLWGGERRSIGVRSPGALLEDRERPPYVLVCNMYYESIGKQLKAMGVKWHKYDDKYFFRYQNSAKEQGAGIC